MRKRTEEELNDCQIYVNANAIYAILKSYIPFQHMMRDRGMVLHKTTFQEAELACDLVQRLTGIEFPLETFLGTNDEMSNSALEHYKVLKQGLETYDEFTRDTFMAFYYHLYYRPVSMYFKLYGYMAYPDSLLAFIDYVDGNATAEELKRTFYEIEWATREVEFVDSSRFRQDMIKVQALYQEILIKRSRRSEKSTQADNEEV